MEDEAVTKKCPDADEDIQWLKQSPVGILLKDFWKGLSLKSKREFYFALHRAARWDPIPNKPIFGYSPVSMWPTGTSLDLLKFFREVLDWRMGGQNWQLERAERRKREKSQSA